MWILAVSASVDSAYCISMTPARRGPGAGAACNCVETASRSQPTQLVDDCMLTSRKTIKFKTDINEEHEATPRKSPRFRCLVSWSKRHTTGGGVRHIRIELLKKYLPRCPTPLGCSATAILKVLKYWSRTSCLVMGQLWETFASRNLSRSFPSIPPRDDAASTTGQRPSRAGKLSRWPSLVARMTNPPSRQLATA